MKIRPLLNVILGIGVEITYALLIISSALLISLLFFLKT